MKLRALVIAGLLFAPGAPAGNFVPACALQPPVASDVNYQPRPADFSKIFRSVDALNFPCWIPGLTRVVDMGHVLVDFANIPIDAHKSGLLYEFHCDEALFKSFDRDSRGASGGPAQRVSLELYRFDSPLGAYAAYACFRQGASTVVTRGDGSSEDENSISFWRNNYVTLLRMSPVENDESKAFMSAVADAMASNIEGHASPPAILNYLPYMDRVAGSEKIIMGPISAGKVSRLHSIGELFPAQSVIAAAADYQPSYPYPERLKMMLIDYESAPLAAAAYKKFIDNASEFNNASTVGTANVFKVGGTYTLCQLNGGKVALISNGKKILSLALLAHQINW